MLKNSMRYWRGLALAIGAVAVGAISTNAFSAYPDRPINLVLAFAPGGATDTAARLLATPLSKVLGQPVTVDNRPGAGGAIAAAAVQAARPDGYTLLVSSSVFVVTPSLYKHVGYDPLKDFLPVIEIGSAPNVFVVRPDSPIKTVADLIAMAKKDPTLISYGTPGSGTTPHLAGEVLKIRTGINMTHVPYKGALASVTDLIGGRLQVVSASLTSVMPQIAGNQIRAVVQTGNARWADLPNVPTTTEAGIKDAVSDTFQALFAPAGTPKDVVTLLNKECLAILRQPETIERMKTAGLAVTASTPEALHKRIVEEVPKWRDVVEKGGIKAD
ncbi:MAG: Tripartite-type tricarboxylate transporter, receptor component TctC [Bradyrhizobium sp.]|nr:Tripartite-type tricarboxylate transporter, receptor component TctC [Bradyrhizobium sp.]